MRSLVVLIYSHPEYYPPTLNALNRLSTLYDKIYVLYRSYEAKDFNWTYPANVELVPLGVPMDVRAAERDSYLGKIKNYFAFTAGVRRYLRGKKPHTVLIYDYMPMAAYWLVRKVVPKPSVLWYHNHDVAEKQYIRKGSIAWMAWNAEQRIFPQLNIFSLPAVERKAAFPMEGFKGAFYFIPNFPSKTVYKLEEPKQLASTVRILYQGSIGPNHGLEEIIELLNEPIEGKTFNLVLKGFISDAYKQALTALATKNSVEDKLLFIGPTGYKAVVTNALTCHIGIGIHKKTDFMNKTLGTASNKIYEYAGAGLPVLLYDNRHFREYLQQYEWAFFTDCSADSLRENLRLIIVNYERLSRRARADFESALNFETYFDKVDDYLQQQPEVK